MPADPGIRRRSPGLPAREVDCRRKGPDEKVGDNRMGVERGELVGRLRRRRGHLNVGEIERRARATIGSCPDARTWCVGEYGNTAALDLGCLAGDLSCFGAAPAAVVRWGRCDSDSGSCGSRCCARASVVCGPAGTDVRQDAQERGGERAYDRCGFVDHAGALG